MSFPSTIYYAGPGITARYTPANGFEVRDLATGNWLKANHLAERIINDGRAISKDQAELTFKRQQIKSGFPVRSMSTQVGITRLFAILRKIPK